MKKTFQIIRTSVPANQSVSIIEQLRQDYSFTTGFFVVPTTENTSLQNVTVSLKIASNEILPAETDIALFAFNDRKSVAETLYDFRADNIPARSAEAEIILTNRTATEQRFNIYLSLEN